MGHDQLFKDLLRAFFFDFLTLFLPEVAAGIKPDAITFLDPQTFTDVPEGQLRLADLVAQVESPDGTPDLVLIHTEVQAALEQDFGYRVWEYNALLRLRMRRPVLSVALLPFTGTGPVGLARYTEALFGREYTRLEYWQVGLRDLVAAEYLEAASPLGPTLASLMHPGAGGKVDLKLAIVRRLRDSGLDEARLLLAANFMETYLPLSAREQAALAARARGRGGKRGSDRAHLGRQALAARPDGRAAGRA